MANNQKEEQQDIMIDQQNVGEEVEFETETEADIEIETEQEQAICFNQDEIKKMMEELDVKNRLLTEEADRLKRLQADFENFRRRTRQEKEELSQFVTQGIIADIVPVLDNFERALASAATQDAASVLAGVEMIYRQFSAVMDKVGVAPIQAVGELFDPQKHEAVMRIQDDQQQDGLIVEELQKGYMVGDKVIRPSMVKVVNND